MSRRSIVLASLLLAGLVLACGSTQPQAQITSTAVPTAAGDAATAAVPATEPTAAAEPTAAPAPTSAPAPTEAPAATVAKVGDRVEANGVALTVVKVEKKAELSQFMKAKEGNTFIVAEVLIESVSADKAPYNPFYFTVKDGDGFEYTTAFGADQALQSGELAQGEKARGNVAFEVKAGAAGLVMEYKPLTFGDVAAIRVALD